MMIHHQVCEAVNVVAGSNQEALIEFERTKTDEVFAHSKLCEGHKPDLKRFRECVENFTESAARHKIGAAPFIYGEGQDYWAEIDHRYWNNYDKRNYFKDRVDVATLKLFNERAKQKQVMEAHLNYLTMTERDLTKNLISQAVSDFSIRGVM